MSVDIVDHPPTVTAAPAARRTARTLASQTVLALADQAVVSGTRFLTTLAIGRLCGPTELGAYTLSFGWLVLIAALQESLITLPYTVFGNRLSPRRRAAAAGSAVVHYLLLSAIAAAALGLAAAVLAAGSLPRMSTVIAALAVTIPFALLSEFARRMAIAHLHLAAALAVDVSAAIVWLSGLALLHGVSRLSAATAWLAIGGGCAVAGLAWLWPQRRGFSFKRGQILRDLRRNWEFGRWLVATQMTSIARGYAIPWALAVLHGTPAVGILSAYEAVLLVCNPLLLGASNLLLPNMSQAFAQGRSVAVRQVVLRATLMLTLTVAALSIVLFLAGEAIVGRLFGPSFTGHALLMTLLALALPVEALGLSAGSGLCALERPRANFLASLAGLMVALVVAALTLSPFGPAGAAAAMLAGKLTASLVQCAAFWQVSRPVREGSPA
jgi:O-antigen/teichoic acid export membrane protein